MRTVAKCYLCPLRANFIVVEGPEQIPAAPVCAEHAGSHALSSLPSIGLTMFQALEIIRRHPGINKRGVCQLAAALLHVEVGYPVINRLIRIGAVAVAPSGYSRALTATSFGLRLYPITLPAR